MHPSNEFLELQAALAGEYSLARELGRGGMGVVYLARDVQLDRDVAIKVLPAEHARTPEMRQQFLREARTAAGLSHPHIVPIHRVGEAGGFVFFVMSYIDGETLGERLRTQGPLPPAEATRVLREVAWALAYAHRHGIVHRDVKPDNILLEAGTGRALVTDFGIAHGRRDADAAADASKVRGTAHFMSPEQAAGVDVDNRSDIYALGVVGYLAVSGRLPYESTDETALALRQATQDAASVAAVAPGLPPTLSSAIDRCLARDPAQRFADAEKLADALVPPSETRPALPATLRTWLAARNPLAVPYVAWTSVWGLVGVSNIISHLNGSSEAELVWGLILPMTAMAMPVFPIIGYHLNHAWRQFRAGHSLADLRAAIAVEQREWSQDDALTRVDHEPLSHRFLRLATAGVSSWAAVILFMLVAGIEGDMGPEHILPPFLGTLLLGAVSNVLDVQFVPPKVKKFWQTGIRDRLWNSWVGESIAKLMRAPERSQLAGAAAFRATESALGVAASELFAALPTKYRDHLAALPPVVEALEARAAAARAEIDVVNALVPSEFTGSEVLAARKQTAAAQLGETVAALERIRLDLLRLHAGAADLAPLTTLMDAARGAGEDLRRLGEAQREVDDVAGRRVGVDRLRTPA